MSSSFQIYTFFVKGIIHNFKLLVYNEESYNMTLFYKLSKNHYKNLASHEIEFYTQI